MGRSAGGRSGTLAPAARFGLCWGRVTEWSNSGNLKVGMEPGSNVTGARTFTRESHQDDVLRPVQGR